MLRSARDLSRYTIHATDGELGRVAELYFDDEHWTVRYFVVRTGSFFSGRDVLLTPQHVTAIDSTRLCVRVSLTQEQVRDSPDISTDRPVSRQQEVEYLRYYDQPPYWALGAEVGGAAIALDAAMRAAAARDEAAGAAPPTHLRSSQEVSTYHLETPDGPIGQIKDFILDDDSWAIRYLVIDPSRWKIHDEVAVPASLVDRVSWGRRCLHVRVTRDQVRTAPHFAGLESLTPEFEAAQSRHFATS
jgi:hypothetical protein